MRGLLIGISLVAEMGLSGSQHASLTGRVAVYGAEPASFPPLGSPGDKPVGLLRVNTATRSSATAVLDPAGAPCFKLPPGARARLVERSEAAKILVGLSERDDRLAAQIQDSPMLRLVEAGESTAVQLEKCDNGAWALTDSVSGKEETADKQVLVQIPQGRLDRARAVLEHYVQELPFPAEHPHQPP